MRARLVRIVLASLFVLLTSALAHAEDPPATAGAAASARAPANWSLGGGISYGDTILVSSSSATAGLSVFRAPAADASLERRLSERTWFVVGVSAAVFRHREDVPEGSFGYERDDSRIVRASAGLRRVLTRRSAPIEVSALVELQGGVSDGEQRVRNWTGVVTRQDQTTWFAGAQLGLAVDRELTDGLSLRVATPLVHGGYTSGNIRSLGLPDAHSSDVVAGALIAPRLELRLLF